jgi:hypothetical protein
MNLVLKSAGFPTVIIPVEDRAAYYQMLNKAGKDARTTVHSSSSLLSWSNEVSSPIGICSA